MLSPLLNSVQWLNIILISVVLWLAVLFIKKNIRNRPLLLLEIIYIFTVTVILFLPTGVYKAEIDFNYFQLVPFKQISSYIKNNNYFSIIANTFILFPVPLFVYFNRVHFKTNVILSLIAAIAIEPIQLIINIVTQYPNKIIDIDDFIMEFTGIMIGLIFAYILDRLNLTQNIKLQKQVIK